MNNVMTSVIRHLTIFDVTLLLPVLALSLYGHRRAFIICWSITSALMIALSFALSRLASLVIWDPRPHTVMHLSFLTPFRPFLPHLMTNSFPSGHAVLTGIIVATVFLANRRWSIPFIVLGLLINWAREGIGFHRTVDVGGGWLIVLVAMVLAAFVGTVLTALLMPSVSPRIDAARARLQRSGGAAIDVIPDATT